MDTGKRHEIPVLELNDSLLLITTAVARILAFLVLVFQNPVHTEPYKELDNTAHIVGCFAVEVL